VLLALRLTLAVCAGTIRTDKIWYRLQERSDCITFYPLTLASLGKLTVALAPAFDVAWCIIFLMILILCTKPCASQKIKEDVYIQEANFTPLPPIWPTLLKKLCSTTEENHVPDKCLNMIY
jgi:multisubunit Na+/H+ antiporter MnhG subunit